MGVFCGICVILFGIGGIIFVGKLFKGGFKRIVSFCGLGVVVFVFWIGGIR